ncbi:MAG: nucleotidyl transferase AbiEii/AbiGii toxin family protein [Gammaproteobacteria bacterium]|nr:nucleotidyl transferase AbiEii/AbiGii toxin family protein [Gammaproteobacteria bacterium]
MPALELSLTEPAQTLFARTAPALAEWLPPILPPGGAWCIGGGTILAAQWRHRLSTDVDVFVPGHASMAALSPEWDTQFVNVMQSLGANHVAVQARSLKFTFPSGRVEITALDPTPPLEPQHATVDGREVRILPNVCILAGKIAGRGMRMPSRDVFDICVARERDPLALMGAINHVSAPMRAEIIARLIEGERRYLANAPEEVPVPAQQWRRLLSDAPREAAKILTDCAYVKVGLAYADQSASVDVENQTGERASSRFGTPKALLDGLLGMGLEQWVLGNYRVTEAFLAEAQREFDAMRGAGNRQR